MKKEIGIGLVEVESQIEIKCECGNLSKINTDFEINIIGLIQFRCNKCKAIINSQDILWKQHKGD